MDHLSKINTVELEKYFKPLSQCSLCDGNQFTHLFEINKLVFFECNSCKFRFMNPYLSDEGMRLLYENSDILAQINPALENYYEYATNQKNNRTIQDYQAVLQFVSKNLQPQINKPKLFEVGFGRGGFLLEAARHGWEVDGIDGSKQNSSFLNHEYDFHLQCGAYEEYESQKSHYQMLVFWDVIEHTVDPKSYIQKAAQMLAPGGFLVLATPNIAGLLNQVSEAIYFFSLGKIKAGIKKLYIFEHVGYYTPRTLKQLVSMEDFEIKKTFFTETDLECYKFSSPLKFCLKIFFFIASCLNRENRVILIAQKKTHGS